LALAAPVKPPPCVAVEAELVALAVVDAPTIEPSVVERKDVVVNLAVGVLAL
jgi:hypothetical protein